MVPIAPACFSAAQRTAADCACALSASGDAGRAADQVDHHLAAQILAGEVVDLQLGDLQAVADEDQRRLDLRRRIESHRERRIRAERDRFGLAVAHQGQARLAPRRSCVT